MYKSPIEIIMNDVQTRYEDEVFKMVQNYNIEVDKDELIKALQYDRDTYDKGYREGSEKTFAKCIDILANKMQDLFPRSDYYYRCRFFEDLLKRVEE